MYKYIVAAILGLFSSPVYCLTQHVYYYEFGFSDLFLACLYALIVWCWCGNNGVYQQLKDYFERRKNNVHR